MGVGRARVVLAVMMTLVLAACGDSETTPAGGIRLICEPDSASVYVNEIYSGQARALAAGAIRIAPGRYRLHVAEDGYFDHYEEVRVRRRIVTVRVTLRSRPQ